MSLPRNDNLNNNFNNSDTLNNKKLVLNRHSSCVRHGTKFLGGLLVFNAHGSRWESDCGYAHFTEEDTEAQRDEATRPGSHG